tara:strand:+ start:1008 stop:1235 length:228 start_codon:yes stop_codon:yes gene_type:complete
MAKVYTYGKELVAEVENNIDEYIFFEFLVAYRKLIEQVSDVNDGMGTKPHALLMDYLSFKLTEERDEHFKNQMGV